MENPTNEHPEPRTEFIEARKVSMMTLEAKEVPLVKEEEQGSPELEKDDFERVDVEKDYIPTSNLLQVRNVAYSTMEEEKPESGKEQEPRNAHTLFYGSVMGDRATVDYTMIEKKIDKQG